MTKFDIFQKLQAIIWKHYIIRRRRWFFTLLEVVVPMYVAISIVITHQSDLKKHFNNQTIYYPLRNSNELYQKHFDRTMEIYYVPTSNFTQELMDNVISLMELTTVRRFSTETELNTYFQQHGVTQDSILAVIFEPTKENMPGECNYVLRPYKLQMIWETDNLFPKKLNIAQKSGSQIYIQQSVMAMKMAIDLTFLEMMVDKKEVSFDFSIQQFPYSQSEDKKSVYRMQELIPHTIMFSYALLCLIILHKVVRDQRIGIKELMKMFGVKQWMIWFGWFLNFFVLNFVVITVIVICLVLPLSSTIHAPFEYSNPIILALFHILYGAAAIISIFTLSTLYTKPVLVVIVGTFTWIMSFYLPSGIVKYNPYLDWNYRLLLLLLPNACLLFGYEEITYYEKKEIGIQWNVTEIYLEETRNVKFNTILIMLAVDIIFYFLLTLYIESIKPGRYGTAKSFTYPCEVCCNFLGKLCESNDSEDEEEINEKSSNENFCKKMERFLDKPVKIKIRNLSKEYNTVTAVNKLSMNVYQGEITVITGHNGAGKTTILNVITGLTSATNGSVLVNGKEVEMYSKELTEFVGFCPQNDLLFSNMTVLEHFIIFGMLKGLTKVEAEFEANELIFRLGVHLQSRNLGAQIYGGTKRKVALGIALIGNPDLLILDEPTVGLDPESSRSVWRLLLSLKGLKTILIATHSMEEAETLADQIAIIDHGNLVCFGSPNYLKTEFAVGYCLLIDYITLRRRGTLTGQKSGLNIATGILEDTIKEMEKAPGNNETNNVLQIMKIIEHIIPFASLQSNNKNRLTIWLPDDTKSLFGILFDTLEKSSEELGIIKIDLDVRNSLEEVFSRFESMLSEEDTEEEYTKKEKEIVRKCAEPYSKFLTGRKKRLFQISTLFRKRMYETNGSWKLYLFALLLTLLSTLLTVHLENNWRDIYDDSSNTFYFDLYPYGESIVYYSAPNADTSKILSNISEQYELAVTQQGAKAYKVPSVSHAIIQQGAVNLKSFVVAAEFNSSGKNSRGIINAMYSNNATHGAPISLNLIMNAVVKVLIGNDYFIQSAIKPFPKLKTIVKEKGFSSVITFWATLFPMGLLLFVTVFLLVPIYENSLKSKRLQIMSGIHPFTYWATHYIWDFSLYLLMMALTLLIICFYGLSYNIPYSGYKEIGALTSVLITYGLSVIPFTYLFSYTRVASEGFLSFIVINLVITLILMYHFVLDDLNTELNNVVNFFKHMFFLYPQFGLTYASLTFSRQVHWNFNWKLTPSEEKYSLCRYEYTPCCEGYSVPDCIKYRSYFIGNRPIQNIIIIMFCSTFLYILLIIILESKAIRRCWDRMINHYDKYDLSMIDRARRYDVIWEQKRVGTTYKIEKLSNKAIMQSYRIYQNADLLLAWNLQKHYRRKRVLSGISFGLKPGDCFGLVGVNGVGKTTLFRVLTGDLPRINGDARIYHNNVLAYLSVNKKAYLEKIGYCPQVNSVLHMLTGREILQFTAQLYGVHNRIEEEVYKWMAALGLEEYADMLSKDYSEGTKRKLCVAMALIGNPLLILLDEPTNSVDPGSRRKLWSIIRLLLRKEDNPSAVIVASHLMDECEKMCNKIAIMKPGRFDCFGLVPRIKEKYGEGYNITLYLKTYSNFEASPTVTVSPDDKRTIHVVDRETIEFKNLVAEFENIFKGIFVLQEKHKLMLQYRIVDSLKTWGELFGNVEKLKKNHWIIDDYTINRSSLEETFLLVAKS